MSGPNGLSATAPAFALSNAFFYAIAQATYSLSDIVTMIVGAQLPIEPANSEFGDIPLAPNTLAPNTLPSFEQPARFYVQLRGYF